MKMKKTVFALAFSFLQLRWEKLLFACTQVLSPYLLAWLVLAVTQG